MVTVEVTSAFVVDGLVVLPGRVVELPRSDAVGLVARGKAVVVDPGKGTDETPGVVGEDGLPVLDEVVAGEAEEGTEEAKDVSVARGRRKRG